MATNQSSERFVKQVVALCCRRFKPDQYQVELFKQKLSKWYLTEDEWARAMSKLSADYTDEGLPALGVIYGILKDCRRDKQTGGRAMLSFTLNGLPYVLAEFDPNCKPDVRNPLRPKPIDPQCPPAAPEGAENVHVIIPPDQQDKTQERYYGQQVDDLVASTL